MKRNDFRKRRITQLPFSFFLHDCKTNKKISILALKKVLCICDSQMTKNEVKS